MTPVRKSNRAGEGIAVGVALGVAVGAAMGNVGAGIAIPGSAEEFRSSQEA